MCFTTIFIKRGEKSKHNIYCAPYCMPETVLMLKKALRLQGTLKSLGVVDKQTGKAPYDKSSKVKQASTDTLAVLARYLISLGRSGKAS